MEPHLEFFDILQKGAPELAGHLEEIRRRGLEDWVNFQVPDLGSHAGYPHLLNVERIANQIVPDNRKAEFSMGEIFLLLSAIFFHDIGRTSNEPYEPPTKCPAECANNPERPCTKVMWNHHDVGRRMVRDHGVALGLPDDRIADYCGLLVFCHGLTRPPLEMQPYFGQGCTATWPAEGEFRPTSLALYGTLRIPLLASILRIADETDSSWTRGVRDYWFNLSRRNPANLGKAFRRCIEDIEFCHEGHCLMLHVPHSERIAQARELRNAYIEGINRVREDIKTVLGRWGGELARLGVVLEHIYIEYDNHLYLELHPRKRPKPLCEVLDDGSAGNAEALVEALIRLSLGSYGYEAFGWESLEGQIGRPLTDVDRWLTKRIADASSGRVVVTDLGQLRITLSRSEVGTFRKAITGRRHPA